MKINDVITENKKIDEAPVGALAQMGRKLGSKALNKIGAKNTAANMAGKADLGATANRLYQQFNRFLGTQNRSIKQATGQDLKRFLKGKNVQVNVPNGPIDSSRLDKMFLKVARDAMNRTTRPANQQPPAQPNAGAGGQQSTAQPNAGAGGQPQPANVKIPKGLTLTASDGKKYVWRGAQWAMIGKSGKPSQTAKKNIGQELNKEAQKAMTSLPGDLATTLANLTPAQKQIIQSMV